MSVSSVEEIKTVLVKETKIILSDPKSEITAEAPLANLGFDSMSFIELLVSIEKNFKIKLIEVGMQPEDMQTLGTLANCIHRGL